MSHDYFQSRFDSGIYRDCKWCRGRGCIHCETEANAEYKRQFPDGPKPIITIPIPEGKTGMDVILGLFPGVVISAPLARPTRDLTSREVIAKGEIYERRCAGYVTTTEPIPMGSKDGKGPWNGEPDRMIPAGATLKIVMASSMGDCGLTDNLETTNGYQVRLDWDDAAITDIRLTPEPTQ